MKRSRTSEIWSQFTVESEHNKIAVCNLCKQKCSFKTTVSNLKKHIHNKHVGVTPASSQLRQVQENLNTVCVAQTSTVQNVSSVDVVPLVGTIIENRPNASEARQMVQTQISMQVKKMTASQRVTIDEKLLMLFIKDFQPFSVVEDKGFREYTTALNPAYQLPTRQHISNTLMPAMYERVQTNAIKNITSLSLTTDLWTSASQESYIAVMAHYIDEEYRCRKILLECAPLPGSHTATNIAAEISRLMNDLSLEKKQILIITTDNARNMENAVKIHLGLKHFGCFAHTLNLVVENALEVEEVKTTIDTVKCIVSYYKRSTTAMEKLLRYQIQTGVAQPKRLLQSVPTRWNSVFFMLQRFLELEDALRSTSGLLEREIPMPSVEQWKICKDLCSILNPLQEVTQQMSGEDYVTGSLVIVFNRILLNVYENKISSSVHPEVAKSVNVIINQLKIRLGPIEHSGTFSICTLLDPRYKTHCFQDKTASEKAKKTLIELVATEIRKKNLNNSRPALPEPSTSAPSNISDKLSIWENLNEILGEVEPIQSPHACAIVEVQRYLEDKLLPLKDAQGNLLNPSDWWSNHKYVYPNLAQIYRIKCCAMSTSVSCERIFSKSGYIISDRRTRLKSEKVKQLMFLNVNM
ncbi:Uncharacterized protein OBRU01_02555 [Operophtera brumata]|uniref:BED-type domain-containing protein n=1 Tax=Operophtera brumata TaxID=104452 RepID=A0A0L7LFD6_OPEBR|nr:Uncharacterized protein OBRU01_02555 [Operophtera brumata]